MPKNAPIKYSEIVEGESDIDEDEDEDEQNEEQI